MIFVDTHAHLYLENFDQDRELIVKNAIKLGVEKIILPNIDSHSVEDMKSLCRKFPDNIFPLIGLHPTSVKFNYKEELEIVKSELDSCKYYGIGETGIDLYWDKTYFENQKKAFIFQIELAIDYDLPIIIHARESFNEIFNVLEQYKGRKLKGIFHAFTGSIEMAKKIANEFGLSLGIGGIVTFKNSGLDKVIEHISLEHIVLETDSPFLAPVPYRGKRNESAYLIHIAEKIAQIKNLSLKDVAEITTKNALFIFGL